MAQKIAILARILHDGFYCYDAEHIARSFAVKPKVVITFRALFLDASLETILSTIISCRGFSPVAEFAVQSTEVFACRLGRGNEVVAHIHLVIYFQSIFRAGAGDKLPEALGFGRRGGVGQPTLDDTQIFEVVGDSVSFEDGLDNGEIAVGAFEIEDGARLTVHVHNQLIVESLAYVKLLQRNPFAGKGQSVGGVG